MNELVGSLVPIIIWVLIIVLFVNPLAEEDFAQLREAKKRHQLYSHTKKNGTIKEENLWLKLLLALSPLIAIFIGGILIIIYTF